MLMKLRNMFPLKNIICIYKLIIHCLKLPERHDNPGPFEPTLRIQETPQLRLINISDVIGASGARRRRRLPCRRNGSDVR